MLNTTQMKTASMTANAPDPTSNVHWLRMLAALIREHALSHYATTDSALHRRSVAALRQLYVRGREEAMSEPVRTIARYRRRSTAAPYFAPSRHSFGK